MAAKINQNGSGESTRSVEDSSKNETMTNKDAYMFPIFGSMVLFGIYTLYKYLPNGWLNVAFSIHFTFMGLLCLANLFEYPLSKFTPSNWTQIEVLNIKKTLDLKFYQKKIDIQLNYLEAVSISISLFPTILYIVTKGNISSNWLYNNIFGLAFSIIGIQQLVLPSFKTGFILLWGLFFYDIFWVYGTDVMVSVAKNFDVPIKLIFPYDWNSDPHKFSMLGLGDIVIPGIFVGLCLKYDIDNFLAKSKDIRNLKTPLFNACYLGYIIGILITYFVMVFFQHAQPALLFLVPSCTFAVLIQGFLSNKLKQIWSYEESPTEEVKKAT